ncbi:MAG TPA: LacI family DNA-binding transcriptional regulator [Bacteroidales bacterium]|nr:LacI family DNA-binding transcriptional regulator [Bacteroidales bacterium]
MKTHQVTIKDVARELGVSVSTVSRALKDHPDISASTRKLVHETVERMKYKPNAIALSLRSQRSNIIGVIIPEIVHHFFSSVISGIDEAAVAEGYNVMFFQSNESYDREVRIIQSILSSRADGVLISVAKGTKKFGHIRQIIENNIPLVFFDRACDEIETDRVIVDDFEGAYNAVDYLVKTGCKRIAHFAGPQHLQISYLRKRGYITALEKNGLKVDDDMIVICDEYEDAFAVTRQIMSKPVPPDAIFTVNDMTAVGTLNALKTLGFKVPEDVSIVGFTDGLVSSVTDPLLTTVSQHGFEIGKKASEILIKRINEQINSAKPLTEVVKTELVIRDSTKKI